MFCLQPNLISSSGSCSASSAADTENFSLLRSSDEWSLVKCHRKWWFLVHRKLQHKTQAHAIHSIAISSGSSSPWSCKSVAVFEFRHSRHSQMLKRGLEGISISLLLGLTWSNFTNWRLFQIVCLLLALYQKMTTMSTMSLWLEVLSSQYFPFSCKNYFF